MKNSAVLYGLIGLILGGVLMALFVSNINNFGQKIIQNNNDIKDNTTNKGKSMTMEEMSIALEGKTGDEFDNLFLEIMIDHHQGAIDMATKALISSGHEEIKGLANDIIATQTEEILQMKNWQKKWAYTANSTNKDITWNDVESLILTCKVKMSIETHAGYLYLTLKDNSTRKTKDFNQTELSNIIQQANKTCDTKIAVGME